MYQATLTLQATNMKTGPIPVSSTERKSCPSNCSLRGGRGCYAEQGPITTVWNRLDSGEIGDDWDGFCQKIKDLPVNQLWRHNQMGDLPGHHGLIDENALVKLVEANHGKRGFTYTHYSPFKGENARIIKWANDNGFTINLSADSLTQVDRYVELGVGPIVTVLPKGHRGNITYTPEGNKVLVCLAEYVEYMTCSVCKKCLGGVDRPIIGFIAHGTRANKATETYYKSFEEWRRVTKRGVLYQISQGRTTISDIAYGLGYKSMCGESFRKISEVRNVVMGDRVRRMFFFEKGC